MAKLESHTKAGIRWFGESLKLFKKAPRKALLYTLPFMGVLVFFPAILLFWSPVFTIFAMRAYRNTEFGKSEALSATMQLIRPKLGKLLILGLINIAYLILIGVILRDDLVLMAELIEKQPQLSPAAYEVAAKEMMPVFFKLVLLLVPLMVAEFFAPMLIVFNHYPIVKAIKSSIAGCIQYLVALLAGWLLLSGSVIVLFMLADLLVGLVALVMPSIIFGFRAVVAFGCLMVAIAAYLAFQYVSYRDIYRTA